MDAQVTAQQLQQPSGSFHFPKWYSDYVGSGSNSLGPAEIGSARCQIYRLTFLHRDGSQARAEETRKRVWNSASASSQQLQHDHQSRQRQQQHQFPALRPTRALPADSLAASTTGPHRLLPSVVHIGKPAQQSRDLPGVAKSKSFVAAAVPPARPALYSSIRAVHGGGRTRARQRAVETIPSVESIRQSVQLPSILVKKLT